MGNFCAFFVDCGFPLLPLVSLPNHSTPAPEVHLPTALPAPEAQSPAAPKVQEHPPVPVPVAPAPVPTPDPEILLLIPEEEKDLEWDPLGTTLTPAPRTTPRTTPRCPPCLTSRPGPHLSVSHRGRGHLRWGQVPLNLPPPSLVGPLTPACRLPAGPFAPTCRSPVNPPVMARRSPVVSPATACYSLAPPLAIAAVTCCSSSSLLTSSDSPSCSLSPPPAIPPHLLQLYRIFAWGPYCSCLMVTRSPFDSLAPPAFCIFAPWFHLSCRCAPCVFSPFVCSSFVPSRSLHSPSWCTSYWLVSSWRQITELLPTLTLSCKPSMLILSSCHVYKKNGACSFIWYSTVTCNIES